MGRGELRGRLEEYIGDNSRLEKVGQIRDVHERNNVQRKLDQDRQQHVEVENIAQWSFARKLLDGLNNTTHVSKKTLQMAHTPYLCARDAQEADRHQHPAYSNLVITKLDPIEILYAQGVCGDETVQCQDLVHLDGRHQSTAALPYDVGN